MSENMESASVFEEFSVKTPNGLTFKGKHWQTKRKRGLPILALHGWLDNCATYNLLAPALNADVYAIDMAGHGKSGHRPKGVRYHLIDNVDDIFAVADALGFDQFILMGHSMGAGVATYAAAISPERITQLVLIEGLGTHTSPSEQAPEVLAAAVKDMKRAHKIKMPVYPLLSDAVAARRGVVGKVSVAAATHLCERGLIGVPGGMTWTSDPRLKMGSAIRLTEDMVMAYLKRIGARTLLIGAETGFFPSAGPLKSRLDAVPDITLATFAGNHHLHLESDTYQPVANAINDFLGFSA